MKGQVLLFKIYWNKFLSVTNNFDLLPVLYLDPKGLTFLSKFKKVLKKILLTNLLLYNILSNPFVNNAALFLFDF